MSKKRLYLMWGIILAFVLVALFPPIGVTTKEGYSSDIYAEGIAWRFVFADKRWEDNRFTYYGNHIASFEWTIEFIVLGVVSAGLWFSFQRGVKNE